MVYSETSCARGRQGSACGGLVGFVRERHKRHLCRFQYKAARRVTLMRWLGCPSICY